MNREQLIEMIAEAIESAWVVDEMQIHDNYDLDVEKATAQILSLTDEYYQEKYAGYVKLCDDQSLPPIPLPVNADAIHESPKFRDVYRWAQQDMLKTVDGKAFRRVELEVKE